MRTIFSVLMLLVCGTAQAASPGETFQRLLGELRVGHTDIDYAELRIAFLNSPRYDPAGFRRPSFEGNLGDPTCSRIMRIADHPLGQDDLYGSINLRSHQLLGDCFAEAGDAARAEHHRAIVKGLMDALAATGDGKTISTAYQPVLQSEATVFLMRAGLKSEYPLLLQANGLAYDIYSVIDAEGRKYQVVFSRKNFIRPR